MKRYKSSTPFWIALATVNVLALIYAINLIHAAKTIGENFFATFALIGVVFVLVVIDAVSIVVMDGLDTGEQAQSRASSPSAYNVHRDNRIEH
jgi:hypothetical protein